jgi:hypothetical protein
VNPHSQALTGTQGLHAVLSAARALAVGVWQGSCASMRRCWDSSMALARPLVAGEDRARKGNDLSLAGSTQFICTSGLGHVGGEHDPEGDSVLLIWLGTTVKWHSRTSIRVGTDADASTLLCSVQTVLQAGHSAMLGSTVSRMDWQACSDPSTSARTLARVQHQNDCLQRGCPDLGSTRQGTKTPVRDQSTTRPASP